MTPPPTDSPVAAADAPTPAYPFPAGSVFVDGHRLPRLVIFDLDYTLWPFWVDTHVAAPVKLAAKKTQTQLEDKQGSREFVPAAVVDKFGETYAFYPDVPHMLQALPLAGVQMGVASRTHAPELAREVLALLTVPQEIKKTKAKETRALDVFAAGLEIYPANKLQHMRALHERTQVAYEEMLFFDDESRNLNVETLGVKMKLVKGPLDWAMMEQGVKEWRAKHGHSGGSDAPKRRGGRGSKQ